MEQDKYSEALERAKAWAEGTLSPETTSPKEVIELIFPELAESEDERMLREIINYVREQGNKPTGLPNGTVPVADMIAYLEKQKEIPMPSSTELIELWNKEKTMLEEKDFRGDEWRLAYTAYMDGFADGACVKLGKQKEQEPELDGEVNSQIWQIANNSAKTFEQSFAILAATKKAYDKGKKDAKKEQKPAEWSEEDKVTIDCAVDVIEEAGLPSLAASLKSLRPQPKAEKSDYITPHKEFFRWIYDRLINVHKEDPNVDYMISFKQRIEELPLNEPQWKPSKEQMEDEKQNYSGLTDFEQAIHRGFLCAGMENVPVTIIKETAQDCLSHIEKPAKWSEEDEKMIADIIDNLRRYQLSSPNYQVEMQIRWLRFHRPGASWKPREDQMEAMGYFVRKHQATANRATTKWPEFEAFKSLYHDLKKLM